VIAQQVTAQSAALFAAGVVAFEFALWYIAKWIWALGLWKNDRNIERREQRESLQESDQA
jgi:hypothetical protein